MFLSQQIQLHRQRLGLTQDQLAAKLYVSRQTISNWENERNYPDIENLLLLSELFDCSLDELVKGDIQMMQAHLTQSAMRRDNKIMLSFLLIGVLSIGPSLFLPDYWWAVIPSICWLIGMIASIHLEHLKKINNVQTFREILAFVSHENVEEAHQQRNSLRDWFTKTGIVLIFGAIAGVLALLSALPYLLMSHGKLF